MANEQRINDIIDIAAITKQVEATEQQLGRIVATIAEINKSGVTFKKADVAGIPEATKQIDELGRATQKLANLQTDAGKAAYQNIQATKELTKAQQLHAQAANEQAGAYSKLMAQTQLANKAARDMAAQYGTNSQQFKDAALKANELNTKLKEIDAEINIHSKNVGNYGGAVTSLRQEIKNLTQTLATMEMQGKNNSKEYKTMVMRLGELKDAVGDVQARSKFFADDARYINTAVQAVQGLVGAYSVYVGVTELVGEKNEELEKIMRKMMALMTIMQGLSQVQKALDKDSYVRVAAGLALDKLKVWWKNLSIVAINAETGATQKATVAQIAYNFAKKSSLGIIGLVIAAVTALVFAMKKHSDAEGQRAKDERERIQQSSVYLRNLNKISESSLMELGTLEALNLKLRSNLKDRKDVSELVKDWNENIGKKYNESLDATGLTLDKLSQKYNDIKAQILAVALAEAAKEEMITAGKEYFEKKKILDVSIDMAKADIVRYSTGKLIDEQNLKSAQIELAKQEAIKKGYEDQIIEIANFIEEQKKLIKVTDTSTDGTDKNTKSTIKYAEGIERIQKILPKQVDATASYYEKLRELNKELQTGLITQKEYNTAYSELNGVYIEAIDNTEKFTKAQMDLLNEIRAAKSTELNKLYEEVPKLAGEGLNLIQSYSDLMSANNDNELKEYEKLQDEKLRILNERLNLGLITEAQYTAQKSNLDLEYDKKKEELERKEFKRKKALAIAEAVINAAAGVIKALGEGSVFGIIQAGIIAAMAGLEIAKINAQYPAYAKGRDGGKAENAIVGEQGWEYITTDTGLFKTPNHATMTYLPQGASVIPHVKSVEIERYLQAPGVVGIKEKESKENHELLNEIKKLNSKPSTNINIDKHGFAVMMAKGGSYVNFVNDHIRIKH